MSDPISDFIYTYFLKTMCYQYNIINTVVYGLVLAAAVFGTYRLLERLKIKIDKKLFYAVIPFILFGGSARALRDHAEISTVFQSVPYLFCSPIIYFVVFAIALGSLLLGMAVQKKFKIEYWKTMVLVGFAILVYNIGNFRIANWAAVAMIGGLFALWIAVLFGFSHFKPKILSRMNAGILSTHLLDASSSFVGITFFKYCEQHVVTGILTGAYTGELSSGAYCGQADIPASLILPFNPWIIFLLKIFVVGGVLYLLDKYSEGGQFKNFLKLIILILGLALGTRDFLTVGMMQA